MVAEGSASVSLWALHGWQHSVHCYGPPTRNTSVFRRCSAEVDELGRHALSCRWSEGRHQHYAALNDIMKRALTSDHIPSRLEPSGLMRSVGKRQDGVTRAPWKSGHLLVWDATYPNTFSPSYDPMQPKSLGKTLILVLTYSHWDHGCCGSKVNGFTEGCAALHSGGDRRPWARDYLFQHLITDQIKRTDI